MMLADDPEALQNIGNTGAINKQLLAGDASATPEAIGSGLNKGPDEYSPYYEITIESTGVGTTNSGNEDLETMEKKSLVITNGMQSKVPINALDPSFGASLNHDGTLMTHYPAHPAGMCWNSCFV